MIQNTDKRNTETSKTSVRKGKFKQRKTLGQKADTHQVPSEYEDKLSYFKGERAVERAIQRLWRLLLSKNLPGSDLVQLVISQPTISRSHSNPNHSLTL